MRAFPLVVVALVLVLAGCAAPAPASQPASVPLITPTSGSAAGAPEESNETLLVGLNLTLHPSDQSSTKEFRVDQAGWLCVDADIVRGAGDAAVTIIDPSGAETTIVSTRDGTLHNETILANDVVPSTWRVRIDVASFEGTVGVNVSQMTA